MRAPAHAPALVRGSMSSLLVVGAGLLATALAAGKAEAWLGTKFAYLVIGLVFIGTLLLVFTFIGSAAVVLWPAASAAGYLLRIPHDHPLMTVDRVWIAGLVAYIALNPRRVVRTPATRFLAFALLWLVVSYGLRAYATSTSLSGPVEIWVDAILLPAVLFVACERYALGGFGNARRLARALMFGGAILGAIGVAERIWGFELATVAGGSVRFDEGIDITRISGPYPAPEPYALTLAVCFAASLYWLLTRKPGERYLLAAISIGLQVSGIAFAYFRAGWLAAIIIAVAALGFRPGRVGRTFGIAVFAAAVALAATSSIQRNSPAAERLGNTSTISARLATYEQGLHMFATHPLFGVGVDQYNAVATAEPPRIVGGVASVPFPHSSYIGLLAEQGIVGFLPFLVLSFAIWPLLQSLRLATRRKELAVLTGVAAGASIAYLIMSLTLTMLPYEPSNAFFAALLGLTCGRLDSVAETQSVPAARAAASG
jgi:O-antigen ligase